MWQRLLAIMGFLACSACQGQPTLPRESKATRAGQQREKVASLPTRLAILIKQQPASSIEESVYQGQRAYLIMPADRAPDSGNEHVLYSGDGRIICEFGGLAGHVTVGSCNIDGIKFVRTLHSRGGY